MQLRNAAIACLSLSDMRLAKEWVGWPVGSTYSDFDENLERYARGDVHGAVSVHRVIDNVRIALLPATNPSVYSIRTPATNTPGSKIPVRTEPDISHSVLMGHRSPDGTQLIATNDDSRSIHVWDLRLIRTQLAQRGLDWNLPAYLPHGPRPGKCETNVSSPNGQRCEELFPQ